MRTLNLEEYDVKIREKGELKYVDLENMQKATYKGVKHDAKGSVQGFDADKLLEAKRTVAKVVIEEIKDKDGEDVEFSQDWLDNLTIDDGMDLMDAIEQETADLLKKKAKGVK